MADAACFYFDANLRGARLHEANLTGSTLSGADLSGVFAEGVTLTRCDASGANLQQAMMNDRASADNNRRWAEILVPGTTPKVHEVWTELEELRVEFKGR